MTADRRAALVEKVKRLFFDYYDDHIESAGDAATAAIELIRAETLEEAARAVIAPALLDSVATSKAIALYDAADAIRALKSK